MTKIEKRLSDILHKHFLEVNKREYMRAQTAACNASWNIHFGPESTTWADKQYCAQLNRVKRFIESRMSDYWVDKDCDFVGEKEPEGYQDEETGEWVEPWLENTYKVTRKEASKLLFGVCAEYI